MYQYCRATLRKIESRRCRSHQVGSLLLRREVYRQIDSSSRVAWVGSFSPSFDDSQFKHAFRSQVQNEAGNHSKLQQQQVNWQNSTRQFSTRSNILDWKNQVKTLIEESNPEKAQLIFDQSVKSEHIDPSKRLASDLLDAWMDYHSSEVLEFHYSKDDTQRQQEILRNIRKASETSHNLLEQIEPFLSARTAFLAEATRTLSNDSASGPKKSRSRKDEKMNPAIVASIKADEELTRRCNAVLRAWAETARLGHEFSKVNASASRNITRAIPQRAQFLLKRMEASLDHAIIQTMMTKSTDGFSNEKMLSKEPVVETATAALEATPTISDSPGESTMAKIFDMTKAATVKPTVESYNYVIDAWGYSNEHLRGSQAERVFEKLKQGTILSNDSKNKTVEVPDGDSHRKIVWAWALSRDRRAAFNATGHLMKMLRKLQEGNLDMEPTLEDYKVVLKAWTHSKDKNSPSKAQSVLKLMDHAYTNGFTFIQPDEECFQYALQTAAKRPELPDLGAMVDDIFLKMKELFLVPNSKCFGAAIRTWRNVAMNEELTATHRERGARKALELLAEIKVAHNQSTLSSVQASTEHVNDVIESISAISNGYRRKMEQAELLLTELEEALADEDSEMPVPNADSYKHVLTVWGTSDSPDKISNAKAILLRLKDNFAVLSEKHKKMDSFVSVFNTFIEVCSSHKARSEEEGLSVLREALAAIGMMRSLEGLNPNASTYASLLHACGNVLPLGDERQKLVEKIFHLCCDDGLVDDVVLVQLRSVATQEQYGQIVIAKSEDIDGMKMVPEAWTINALGGRVITADGRRTKPLSIDGRITVTRAMQDFKMRRLRDKRNRNLLQGGRIGKGTSNPPIVQES